MPKKHSKDTEYDPGKHYPYPNEDEGAERPPFPEGLPGAQPHPGDWLGQLYPSGGAISNNRQAAMLARLMWAASKGAQPRPSPGQVLRNAGFQHGNVLRAYANWLRQSNGSL